VQQMSQTTSTVYDSSLAVSNSPLPQSSINCLQVCRNPIVDAPIAEPCKTLTTPDGYILAREGTRVVACILGDGVLMAYDPTGVTLAEAQGIAKVTGICS
jgi:hypothetical protein